MNESRQTLLPTDEQAERLLRLSKPRPTVPEMRAARVKKAVRAEWTRHAHRRTRRRMAYWAAAAAASVALLVLALDVVPWRPGTGMPDAIALIARLSGNSVSLEVSRGEARLERGIRVDAGSELSTGDDGLIALAMTSGHSIRLDVNSHLRFISDELIVLDHGAIYVDSGVAEPTRAITVRTPWGDVRELGTRYEIRVEESVLRVRVRAGQVTIDAAGETHTADAGVELTLDANGQVSRLATPTFGPEWGWVLRSAPSPTIDQRPLRELLEWTERETGWTVEFRNSALSESARGIVMSGSIESLTPEEALDAVLPTCGLTYRVEGHRLILSQL